MATVKVFPVDDIEVEVIQSPYHKAGTRLMVHRIQADRMAAAGKVKIVEGGRSKTRKTVDKESGTQV